MHHDDPPPFNRLRGPGACARAAVGRGRGSAARDRRLGRAGARRPHIQRRQDLPRPARRRRPEAGAAARRRRAGRGAPARHRLRRQRAQPRRHVDASADADERMGRDQLRHSRHRRSLAQGRAGPAARRRSERRGAAAAGAGHLLGIQRRAHQPARAGAAAPVPPAACPRCSSSTCCGRSAAARASRWQGYDDAWLELPGVGRVQSVPGGSHWGAGVSISAIDQARIGQLVLDGGAHDGRQLVERAWIERMVAPVAIAPCYGRLLWLNPNGRAFPGLSPHAVVHGRRGRPLRRHRSGASTPWSCCAGSTRRTRRDARAHRRGARAR